MISWRRLGLWVCALGLVTQLAAADTSVKLTMKDLEKHGIDGRNFSVYHIADDGRTILAADEPNFLIKKKGTFNRFWLFRLNSDLKVESVKRYDLPLYSIEQANFSPDLKSVVISSKRGSDIHKLNLEDGSLSVVQTHTPGEPGFRIHSDVFSLYLGKLYTIGYFYDKDDVAGEEQMVEIDLNKLGKDAFTTVLELAPIQKQLQGLRIASMLSPQALFFYSEPEKGGPWLVQRWTTAGGLQKLDEGERVTGTWGEGPQAVYAMRRGSSSDLVLAGPSGDKNVIATGPDTYLNPCLAKDGNTVAVATEASPSDVTYWVGQDSDGFKLRKIGEKMQRCTIRISHNGRVVGLYNGITGLVLVKLDGP